VGERSVAVLNRGRRLRGRLLARGRCGFARHDACLR
jgi:hypothetical protein